MNQEYSSVRRLYTIVAAVMAWFALVLQLYLTTMVVAPERGLIAGVIAYLSFFTILTNILAAIALTDPLIAPRSRLGLYFGQPVVQGGVATYITIVGIVYSLLLRSLWQPEGAQLVADAILHDIIPIVFVIQWLAFVPKGWLQWKHAVLWLSYPAVYVVYTIVRGVISGRYPYPFADVTVRGYPRVFANTALLLVAFFIVGLVFVAIDRIVGRRVVRGQP